MSGFHCSQGPKVDRRRSNTRSELAKDSLLRGQLESAETNARQSLAFDPNNEEAHWALGAVEYFRALQNFRLLEIDGCLTGVDAQSLRQEMDKHLVNAEAHLAAAVKSAPDYGEAWAYRGVVAIHLQTPGLAVTYLKEALSYPARLLDVALTRANLGWAYFHTKQYPAAATSLRQALQFRAKMCVATYRLGRVYFARKEWEKALVKFREVAADSSCRSQESQLYLMKTFAALKMIDQLPATRTACVARSAASCIAAQCRAFGQ